MRLVDHVAFFVRDRGRDRDDLARRVDEPGRRRARRRGATPARQSSAEQASASEPRAEVARSACRAARHGSIAWPPGLIDSCRVAACTMLAAAARIGFAPMPTVRDATFDLFRAHGMTTMFGNPGSTELPMLADFPADFRYVLGLQEAVVVGMADGYAQASGRTTVVNLHTAPGVGNAMGAIFNAQANHSPLLVTAGQQARAQITLQANLTNRDATRMPHPLVKWSYEPPRAEDVPLALAHGAHLAALPPQGPVFVSLPMDDWDAEVDDGRRRARRSTAR